MGVFCTPDPSPQKFGVSLIRLVSLTVRIYGERGVSVEQRDSKAFTELASFKRYVKAGSPHNCAQLTDTLTARLELLPAEPIC